MLAGVAQGLATHLRLPVVYVRAAFLLLVGFRGFGALLYVALWIALPLRDTAAPGTHRRLRGAASGALVLTAGILLLTAHGDPFARGPLAFACILAGAGATLIWWQADQAQRRRLLEIMGGADASGGWRGEGRGAVFRFVIGVVLVIAGFATGLFDIGVATTLDALVATGVVVFGVFLVAAPWWWRLVGLLTAERRERIRSQERADVAAHLHDSVLQTLALIQRHAQSPREVIRLARGQERELRAWLYRSERERTSDRFAAALEVTAGEVEDTYLVTVETVTVGDAEIGERLAAVVQATREALVNAARHSGVTEVSLYAEVDGGRATVFVRDRGSGFDPEAVPADRHGVTGSIVGRMRRHGGTATIRSTPGAGTEVELSMELDVAT